MAAEQRRKYKAKLKAATMIASVRGEVLDIALDHVVIEAAGVGYKVMATPSTLATLRRGSEARLITAMIVREDSMTLYGFADADARDLFLTLLGVSGVGPKIALATLAVYDAPSLRQALGRRRRHRADPGSRHRQARRRAHGARTARQDRAVHAASGAVAVERPLGARPGRGSACRTWLCGQAGRGGHRQGARQRARRHHVQRAAGGAVDAGQEV